MVNLVSTVSLHSQYTECQPTWEGIKLDQRCFFHCSSFDGHEERDIDGQNKTLNVLDASDKELRNTSVEDRAHLAAILDAPCEEGIGDF